MNINTNDNLSRGIMHLASVRVARKCHYDTVAGGASDSELDRRIRRRYDNSYLGGFFWCVSPHYSCGCGGYGGRTDGAVEQLCMA